MDLHPDNYNICLAAGTTRGYKHSEESKAKMSAAKVGNRYGVGHIHSPETRKRMSKTMAGNKNAVGAVRSEETRAKLSAAAKAQWERKRVEEVVSGRAPSFEVS